MNPDAVNELLRNSIVLGICVVLFAVLSVRLARRDKYISGKRALVLASLPILSEMVNFSSFWLPVFVAVALGYSLVALVRCPLRIYATIAVVFAFFEVLLIPWAMASPAAELFTGF